MPQLHTYIEKGTRVYGSSVVSEDIDNTIENVENLRLETGWYPVALPLKVRTLQIAISTGSGLRTVNQYLSKDAYPNLSSVEISLRNIGILTELYRSEALKLSRNSSIKVSVVEAFSDLPDMILWKHRDMPCMNGYEE